MSVPLSPVIIERFIVFAVKNSEETAHDISTVVENPRDLSTLLIDLRRSTRKEEALENMIISPLSGHN